MTHILHTSTVQKTASAAGEGNSAYCQKNIINIILNIIERHNEAQTCLFFESLNFALNLVIPKSGNACHCRIKFNLAS